PGTGHSALAVPHRRAAAVSRGRDRRQRLLADRESAPGRGPTPRSAAAGAGRVRQGDAAGRRRVQLTAAAEEGPERDLVAVVGMLSTFAALSAGSARDLRA